jgi:hypothetical protein
VTKLKMLREGQLVRRFVRQVSHEVPFVFPVGASYATVARVAARLARLRPILMLFRL